MAKKKSKDTITFTSPFGKKIQQITDKNGRVYYKELNPHSAEDIRNKPNFEGTRKINRQFSGGSILAKAIHNSHWTQWYDYFRDPRAHSRLTGLCNRFINTNEGIHGQRPASISKNKEYLEGFHLNPEMKLGSYLNQFGYSIGIDKERTQVTAKVDLHFGNVGSIIERYPFVQVVLVVALVSDYQFNPAENVYEPIHPEENGLSVHSVSEVIEVSNKLQTVWPTVHTPLPQPPKEKTNLLVFLGIHYDNRPAKEFEGAPGKKSMELIKIF